jgi:hypothetical protein
MSNMLIITICCCRRIKSWHSFPRSIYHWTDRDTTTPIQTTKISAKTPFLARHLVVGMEFVSLIFWLITQLSSLFHVHVIQILRCYALSLLTGTVNKKLKTISGLTWLQTKHSVGAYNERQCSERRVVSGSSNAPSAEVRQTKTTASSCSAVETSWLFCLKLACREQQGLNSLRKELDPIQYILHISQHENLV